MNQIENLSVPIYLKRDKEEFKWPTHKLFYILAGNGYFICRNHPFYQSCVKLTEHGHPDLEDQEEFLDHSYPKLSQAMMEDIVGFFGAVEKEHSAEAYVLLGYDLHEKEITMLVPEQEVSMASAEYKLPNYPDNWILIGDVHSHERMSAYSSFTDQKDEAKRSGLHMVVGKVHQEPPEFHVEIVVDGARFKLKDPLSIIEGYKHRNTEIPEDWMKKVTRKKYTWSSGDYKSGCYGGYEGGYSDGQTKMSKKERKKYKRFWSGLVGGGYA